MPARRSPLSIAAVVSSLLLLPALVAPARASGDEPWRTLGLMRVRDMTPFGLNRLDFLPAHAVAATPGTFAVEVNSSYQNTWAVSENVKRYLEERGVRRGEIGAADVERILALPGDAYLVDGEFGLVDLTLHYRLSEHVGLYATVPYYFFSGGFLDSTIEGFHHGIGIADAGRGLAPRNRFQVAAKIGSTRFLLDEAPADDLGDPILGLRYSLVSMPERGNILVEAAAKVARGGGERLVSTGHDDFGAQISFQRFFRRDAIYLSLSAVDFENPDPRLDGGAWIPTVVAGWESRLTRHANLILQTYWSRSTVRRTNLDELSADKLQATAGVQWLQRGYVLRFGVTENLANFDNTPDVGVNLSLGWILDGRRP